MSVPLDRSRVRAVILDVDGTLYLQPPLRRAMLLRLARHTVLRPLDGLRSARVLRAYRAAQEELRRLASPDASRQHDVAAERCGRARDEVQAIVARWMEQEPLALVARHARRGLREFLVHARARGIRVGVFSDYPAADKLAALGIAELVEVVVCAQDADVGRFKPDAAGLLKVARALHCEPPECVYVGDRPEVDAEAARRAGMACAIFAGRSAAGGGWVSVADFAQLHRSLFDGQGSSARDVDPVPVPSSRS